MLELAQQLSYYLSVVDGGATSKLVGFGQQLASVGMIAMTARASIQGLVQPLEQIASTWSGREQQINNITRSLRQYQYVGQSIVDINRDIARSMPGATEAQRGAAFTRVYNQQFEEGRGAARGILQEINRMAAILPGESADYMQSFSQNLQYLSQARGMTDLRAARLTSTLSAGAIAAGLDPAMIARDLTQGLTIGFHATDTSWGNVWSQYATNANGTRMSQQQFNALNMDRKVQALERIAAQLQPMMDATGDSYEALKGTLNSFKHELYLFITEPIFEAWKGTLRSLGLQFEGLRLTIGPVMRVFSQFAADKLTQLNAHIPAAAARIADWFVRMPSHLENLGNAIGTVTGYIRGTGVIQSTGAVMGAVRSVWSRTSDYAHAHVPGRSLGAIAAQMVGPELIAAALMRGFGIALGPVGVLITTLLTRVFLGGGGAAIIAALSEAFTRLYPVVLSIVGGAYRLYEALMVGAAAIVEILLPPIIELASVALQGFLEVVMLVAGFLGNLVAIIGIVVIPAFIVIATALRIIFEVAAAGWRMIMALLGGAGSTSMDFIDAMREATRSINQWSREVMDSLYYLMHEFGMLTDSEYQARIRPSDSASAGPQFLTDLRNSMNNILGEISETSERRGRAPTNRPQVHQDFRYSRFDITQKFAEGFSPERVGAAFTSDLEAMANQRLSSGLAPAFTSG